MTMKKILALLVFLVVPAVACASSAKLELEKAPMNLHDKSSLQRGAQIFVNHCLNCHSAASMRYSRLEDIGLKEAQIRDNLLFTAEKVGEPMATILDPKDAKAFFGVVRRISRSSRARAAPIGSTRTSRASTRIPRPSRDGTTCSSRTSRCRMSSGSTRATSASP
jgi:ubiquinol-cytochrome c reductase cytochrome c1 subunit